jgi:cytochrome c-type biogenesis protein CcmF
VFWVLLTSLYDIKARLTRKNAFLAALISLPRSYKGMVLAHLGVAVCVTGVTITSVYSIERDIRLQVQETLTVGPYDFRLLSLREVEGPNYRATQAKVEVLRKDGTVMAVMEPEKRLYTVQQMPMTEVAIEPGLTRDLYLALGEPLADGAWAMRIYYKPFVRWIWLGALCMALGGVLAISDPRYRLAWKQRRADRTVTVTGKPYVAKA